MSSKDGRRRAKERRRQLREELLAKGVPESEIKGRVNAIVKAAHEASVRQDQEAAQSHLNKLPKNKAKMERKAVAGLTPVQRWYQRNPTPEYDPEPIYEETYRRVRLDDSGYRTPAPARASRKAGPRITGATAQAVSRGRTMTKWEYDQQQKRLTSNAHDQT